MKEEDLQIKIGQRIVELRMKKGWSQSDLARACNKDRQSMERIENGKVMPSVYSLYEIAVALEMKVSKLIDV